MKLRINVQDLDLLTPHGKEQLRGVWEPEWGDVIFDGEELIWEEDQDGCINFDDIKKMTSRGGKWSKCYPLLSIGQMIAFLEDECRKLEVQKQELCDALWSAVVEILNKEEK